ncbi:MAG: hypothetical protein M3069_00540 [Chloroflexota bacterium]|nr:hypothetical protein [Chloroflexota bacterium]
MTGKVNDGEQVTVAPAWRARSCETYHDKHLVRVDPATGARVPLADDPRYADLEPAVSPDGQQIAFVRGWAQVDGQPQGPIAADLHPNVATIASRRIWLVAPDGSNSHPLTNPQDWTDAAPAWTPEGHWVVFVRWRPPRLQQPAAAELWAAHPDGSGARRLATGLDLPQGFNNGFGLYGTLGWQRLFAVAPR